MKDLVMALITVIKLIYRRESMGRKKKRKEKKKERKQANK